MHKAYKTRKTIMLMIALICINVASGLVDDQVNIVSEDIMGIVSNFNQQNYSRFVLVTLKSSDDPVMMADSYLFEKNAELVFLYSQEQNTVTVAKSLNSDISNTDLREIMAEYSNENITITIVNLVPALIDLMGIREVESSDFCRLFKDGVCDMGCSGDLDCLCGDDMCQPFESYVTCPTDCASFTEYKCAVFSDGFCNENCIFLDVDCDFKPAFIDIPIKSAVFFSRLRILLIIVLICLIVVFVGIMTKRREQG